ncbi:MAG: VPLPA-CTERM sorting domain-containing protein [Pseudomonadota bacterium]
MERCLQPYFAAAALVFILGTPVQALAAPITFSFSGALPSKTTLFDVEPIRRMDVAGQSSEFRFHADTEDLSERPGLFWVENASATLSLNGEAAHKITTPTITYLDLRIHQVGFAALNEDLYLMASSHELDSWDMTTDVDPQGKTMRFQSFRFGAFSIPIDGIFLDPGGDLFSGIFSASVGETEAVPLPASLLLLGMGIGALSRLRRKSR